MTEVEWMHIFAKNLREMLFEKKMTQRELAFETGLSEKAISTYVNQERMPGAKALINMSYALDCSLDELADFGDTIE